VIEQVILDRFFGGLRSHLAIFEQHRTYTNLYIGDGFNVFDFIGYDENNLSEVIAKLLDPAGGHGQGTTFLSSLLKLAAAKESRSGLESPFTQLEHAVLRQEKVRIRREHGTAGRRFIDIVVDVGPFRFAIENKPRASDLDNQVRHYIEDLQHSRGRNWGFLYLNGYGASPSCTSLCAKLRLQLLESGRYVEWDYVGDLAQWVQQCAQTCEADKIRWFLRDFRTYILREFASPGNEENQDAR
jgi:hypothetical protein